MPSVHKDFEVKAPTGATRPKSSVLPPGYNWLSAPVPSRVHAHVHHMARLSNMSLKEFLAWFLGTASPHPESALTASNVNENAKSQ